MITSKKNYKINLKKNPSKNHNFFSPFVNAIQNNKLSIINTKTNKKKIQNNVNILNTSQNKQKKINKNQEEINKKQILKTNNNNNYNIKNNNIFKESSTVLPTNCSEEEGKKVISKKNTEEKNPLYLNKIYKQTIIIDEDGNNNLNINKHDKLISDNIFIKNRNKANQDNNKFDDISQDTERLKEYGKIFNMLNNNIEDMKQLFQDNNNNYNNNNKKNIGGKNKGDNKNKFIQIFSKKDIEEIENIQPTPEKKEILNEKDEESFLGSCIRDTFFESLKNKDNCSINEYSSIFSNSNINFDINNLDQTIVEDDENYRTYNFKNNLVINPNFLLTNYKKMNNKKKINSNNNTKHFYTKNKNIKKDNKKEEKGCIIF